MGGISPAFAIQHRHLRRRVTRPGGGTLRHGLLDRREVGLCQRHAERAQGLLQLRPARDPTNGTMSPPCAATQAIAIWATLTPLASAMIRSASTRARLASALSPWKRGLWARKSPGVTASLRQWPLISRATARHRR